jgi:dTDP-4-amino-4,6-dideoxygalactose transaminase
MPVAEGICEVICALPMFPEITQEQQTFVVEKTVEYLKAR